MILSNTLSFPIPWQVRLLESENKNRKKAFQIIRKIIVNTGPTNNFQLREALSFYFQLYQFANNASCDCFL